VNVGIEFSTRVLGVKVIVPVPTPPKRNQKKEIISLGSLRILKKIWFTCSDCGKECQVLRSVDWHCWIPVSRCFL